MQEFKFGCASTNDDTRPGKPSDATNRLEMIKKILRLVPDNYKLQVRKISKW